MRLQGLNLFCSECFHVASEKGWYDAGPPSVPERLMLMVSEISEALEEYRAGYGLKEIYYTADSNGLNKPEGIPIELADCLIRICDFAGSHDLDLEQAIQTKFEYNRQRPYKHGGKKC